jgi:hypothetical protein
MAERLARDLEDRGCSHSTGSNFSLELNLYLSYFIYLFILDFMHKIIGRI